MAPQTPLGQAIYLARCLACEHVSTASQFYDGYTYIYARYCDGASFAGNVELVNNATGTPLYFRGYRILQEIFSYLEDDLGLGQASEALLAGCSAGGLATYIHCDEFATFAQAAAVRAGRASSAVKTRCVADAGYFPDFVALPSNTRYLRTEYQCVVNLQNTTLHTNQQCIDASGTDAWQCFFPQYTAPHLQTPIFAVNSGYDSWQFEADWFAQAPAGSAWYNCSKNISECEGEQLAAVQSFHKEYVAETLTPILTPMSPHGAFIDSCFEHCQSGDTWMTGATIGGQHIGEAVAAWYTGASTGAASKNVMAPYGESQPGSACNVIS